jgi:hypothetical protein
VENGMDLHVYWTTACLEQESVGLNRK